MAVGAGLSSTLGIATETTPGTPVAVTRFIEYDTETMGMKKTTVQGEGLRGGALVRRRARRSKVGRQAGGDIKFDIPTNGFGLFLHHMLGSFSTTPSSIGGGLYQQIHNTGSLAGKAFTTQIVKPDTTGVLAPEAFTYPGCKITSWEISIGQAGLVQVMLSIDAVDEATPTNAAAPTTLASSAASGDTTISTVASIAAGTYITIGTGALAEVRLTSAVSGAGPYTVTVPALTYGHASGAYVGSATGVNYGSAAALQAASYVASVGQWDFTQGALVAGGVVSVSSGVWTLTGGRTVANVRSVSLKGSNALKTDRWGLGSAVKSEQLENNWRDYTADVQVEYNGREFYDEYAADAAIALKLVFTSAAGEVLQFFMPAGFQEDSASPQVGGPDIIIQALKLVGLDDGTNGALQAIYTSTDSSV